jgi:hypothetical protein
MKSLLRLSLFATLGAGAIVFSCKLTVSQQCTPFPPPSVSGASCSALPKLTKIRDLGNLEPGGGVSDASIVVDDHAIYFTASAPGAPAPSLYRMSKAGGDPQVIDQGVRAPIVLDGPSLLYTRVTDTSNFSYPNVIQLGPQCLFEALPNAGVGNIGEGPTVDGAGGVDWLAMTAPGALGDQRVLHWDPRTDSTAVIGSIIGSGDPPWGFVGDADHVYWTLGSYDGITTTTTITSEPSAGGAQAILASLPEPLAIFGVDDEALYLALSTGNEPYTPYTFSPEGPITRVLKTNGSATTVVAHDSGASAYGVHDTHVYWAHGSKVVRAPKTGGPAEVVFDLGDANTILLSIAFDACNVYVNTQPTNSVSSSIWGAPLPQGSPTSADDASALACDDEGDTDASTADADEQ